MPKPATQQPAIVFYNAEQGRVLLRKGREGSHEILLFIDGYYSGQQWERWYLDRADHASGIQWWRLRSQYVEVHTRRDYLTALPESRRGGKNAIYDLELRPLATTDPATHTQLWSIETVPHAQPPGHDLPILPDYVRLWNRATSALVTTNPSHVDRRLVATTNPYEGKNGSWLPVVLG